MRCRKYRSSNSSNIYRWNTWTKITTVIFNRLCSKSMLSIPKQTQTLPWDWKPSRYKKLVHIYIYIYISFVLQYISFYFTDYCPWSLVIWIIKYFLHYIYLRQSVLGILLLSGSISGSMSKISLFMSLIMTAILIIYASIYCYC